MILDARLEFADATALNTGAAGTYLIGSQIDLGSIGRNVGQGQDVYLVISVDTGITVASSTGTLQFKLASDSSASISTTTSTIHAISNSFATSTTEIAAGTVLWVICLPNEWSGATYERYLGLLQVTGTTAINAGKINAFLTTDPAAWKAYADATN